MEKRMVHGQVLPFCINDHTDQSQDPNISIEENIKSRRNAKQLESSKETHNRRVRSIQQTQIRTLMSQTEVYEFEIFSNKEEIKTKSNHL